MEPTRVFGKSLCHNPLDPAIALPPVLADTVEAHARMDAHEVARSRTEFFLALECESFSIERGREETEE